MPRDFHTTVLPGPCRLLAIALMSLLAIVAAIPAGAQELDPDSPPPARDYVSCGHFESQASAQEALDSGLLDELGRQSLDGDGDGIACEDAFPAPDSPPPARDHVSCGGFQTQADAQEVLDYGNLDEQGRQSLDADGDGIACEDAFPDPISAPPTHDYVSCGHFDSQVSAQDMLDSGLLDETGRQSLDGDGDGIACEVRWGEPAAAPAPTASGVTKLPSTGTGSMGTSAHDGALLAGMMVVSGVLLLLSRRLASR